MFYIENEELKIGIESRGAELQTIYSKSTKLDYLWHGDAAFWAKRSPVLFPIVGTLKNDRYYFNDKHYQLSRHGFARTMNFSVSTQSESAIEFLLKDDTGTLMVFPFHFELYIRYSVEKNKLHVQYRVINTGKKEMFFSIGGHPAFKLPLEEGFLFEDYRLEFSDIENTGRYPISPEGLIEALPVSFLNNNNSIAITHELFENDAIVFKHPVSKSVRLLSDKSQHGLNFDFTGFPFLGIWSAKNANFICIEPWCGIADGVASDQQLVHKEGINMLTPEQEFHRQWTVELF